MFQAMDAGALRTRGINYEPAGLAPEAVERDLRAIRDDLGCTAVLVNGGAEPARQLAAAERALALGLEVWIQAHRENARRAATLAHLEQVARGAEALRAANPGRVTLAVGNELTLMSRGIVPGPHTFVRLAVILRARRLLARRMRRRLDTHLAAAEAVARAHFHGPLTYCAALWEHVDWSRFDLVSVNLYRLGDDPQGYTRRLRALIDEHRGTPVAITEFGCGAFTGADRMGPGSFRIVNWFASPPRVRDGHVRDERVQAAYVGELVDLYRAAGVDACFAFTFAMRDFPHHPDPRRDLDMAGFGVVKVDPDDPARWERKLAFAELARRYAAGESRSQHRHGRPGERG